MDPRLRLIAIIIMISTATMTPKVGSKETGQDWINPAFDPWNSGFSPQEKINRDNIDDLELKWVYHFREPDELHGAVPPEGIQTTPLILNGIIYAASGYNELIALEASSGRELWSFGPNLSSYAEKHFWARRLATRSLTIHGEAIYIQTSTCSIYGFHLTSGERIFSLEDTCADIPGNSGQYFGTFAPIFFENLLITRAQGNAFGGRGFVSAYDTVTRQLVWRWFSAPPKGGEENWGIEDAAKGNMEPFGADWGDSELIGGATSWGLAALDEKNGRIYLLTGEPANQFDAALRPGPNLFSNSIVSLDARSGEMLWYYQVTPHDVNNHDPVWKVILADVQHQGTLKRVVIVGVKTNFVYLLDADTGTPIYDPIHLGPPNLNTKNGNEGAEADMFASQRQYVGGIFCPSHLGGIFAGPAFAYNTIYVPMQNVCGTVLQERIEYKGKIIDGFRYRLLLDLPTNGTIYAIDASTGAIKWQTFTPERIQSAAIVVSGGVLYAIDRNGEFYAIDAERGTIIDRIQFNALSSAGPAIGADANGEMLLILPVGGTKLSPGSAGILVAMGLDAPVNNPPSLEFRDLLVVLSLAVAAISTVYSVRLRRRLGSAAVR